MKRAKVTRRDEALGMCEEEDGSCIVSAGGHIESVTLMTPSQPLRPVRRPQTSPRHSGTGQITLTLCFHVGRKLCLESYIYKLDATHRWQMAINVPLRLVWIR